MEEGYDAGHDGCVVFVKLAISRQATLLKHIDQIARSLQDGRDLLNGIAYLLPYLLQSCGGPEDQPETGADDGEVLVLLRQRIRPSADGGGIVLEELAKFMHDASPSALHAIVGVRDGSRGLEGLVWGGRLVDQAGLEMLGHIRKIVSLHSALEAFRFCIHIPVENDQRIGGVGWWLGRALRLENRIAAGPAAEGGEGLLRLPLSLACRRGGGRAAECNGVQGMQYLVHDESRVFERLANGGVRGQLLAPLRNRAVRNAAKVKSRRAGRHAASSIPSAFQSSPSVWTTSRLTTPTSCIR